MDDRHNDDERETLDEGAPEPGRRPGPEGVRIMGADEAAAAIEAGLAGRSAAEASGRGDEPEPPPRPRPSLSFPLTAPEASPSSPSRPERSWDRPTQAWEPPRQQGPSEPKDPGPKDPGPRDPGPRDPAPREHRPPGPEPSSGPTVLPHWSEPATGEVPKILPGEDKPPARDDDLGAWSSLGTGPRWRDQPTDWDQPDFESSSLLSDDETRVGALGGADEAADPSDPFGLDEPSGPVSTRAGNAGGFEPVGRGASGPVAAVRVPGGPEGPAAEPVEGDEFGEGPGRDLGLAVLSGAVIGMVVVIAGLLGPAALLLVCAVALVLGAAELYGALQQKGYHPATLLGLVGTASLVGAAYWKGEQAFPLVVALLVVFSLLWYLLGVVRARPALNVAVTLLAFCYVGFLGGFVGLLLGFPHRHGVAYLMGAIVATVVYDVAAYFVGSRWGRTPLAPNISPRKSWEGLIGASFLTVLASVVVIGRFHPWNLGRAFALGIVVMLAAPLGDLCESMIKRDLGVKDIGWIIPGHGGILDRIDAMLFTVPAVYYLVRLLKIG